MKKEKSKSWVNTKLQDSRFRRKFEAEVERLSIGERLAELRIRAGLTQAALARKVGTTASAISRYENAEYDRYELQTLRKIVVACGGMLRLVMESPDHRAA